MPDIRFTPAARADLANVDEYSFAEFGDEVAAAYSRGFSVVFNLLRRHALAGETRPALGKGVRCIVHRKHRIFYTVTDDHVLILRVFHHARNVRHSQLQ